MAIVTQPEQRIQVTSTRFRVPEVCVLRGGQAREQIIRDAPLICIEILGPDDRMSRVHAKIDDHLRIGVPNVWLIDPENRTGSFCRAAGLVHPATDTFTVPGTDISIPLAELFSTLDEA